MCMRDGRPAERKSVPIVLISTDTKVWPTSKMLDISISASSDLGVCQLKKIFELLSRQVNIWILRQETSLR